MSANVSRIHAATNENLRTTIDEASHQNGEEESINNSLLEPKWLERKWLERKWLEPEWLESNDNDNDTLRKGQPTSVSGLALQA